MSLSAVYKSKASCVAALQAVEQLRPHWWTRECSSFLRRVESVPLVTLPASTSSKQLILLEGIDGTGKTTTALELSKRLRGAFIRTPDPSLAPLRNIFDAQEPTTQRAFYSAANYLAARQATCETGNARFVVFDRWWHSTCAMALANSLGSADALPPAGDSVYEWPRDLPPVAYGALLSLDETARVERIRRRAPAQKEEKELEERRSLREAAMTAYKRFGVLEEVSGETYGIATNAILAGMTARGIQHDAVPFTDEELAGIKSF